MTSQYPMARLAEQVHARFPQAVEEVGPGHLSIRPERLVDVCRLLHDDPELDFKLLVAVSAVDYIDSFEVVYRLLSIQRNHAAVLKVRAYGREEPTALSVTSVWRGAELQEREVYDLMGVRFSGHPDLKRVMLWEGFEGHPLRKDFLLQRP